MHDFYLLTRPLDSADIEATRAQALIADPQLTTKAGLAYRSFARLPATQHRQPVAAGKKPTAASRRTSRRTSRGPLVVTSDEVAGPDPHAMARLLLAIAREQAERTTD